MTRLTQVKLASGAVGLIMLGLGIRWDDAAVRWGGIALVFAAFLMRFLNPRERL